MPRTVELHGRKAAPGLAAGPLFVLPSAASLVRAAGDPARERASLEAAVAAAAAAIGHLAETVDNDAAAILHFQVAMLEDTALIEPALARVAEGADAGTAWFEALAVQIADYSASDSDYFRARASDLEDLRDRVRRLLAGQVDAPLPAGAILTGEDVTPSRFLSVDWSRGGGIALFAGSASSHVAMLARSRGVPMVVGLGAIDVDRHGAAIVDGDTGRIVLSPEASDWAAFEAARTEGVARATRETKAATQPAATADGDPVRVMINVADPAELDLLDPAICDGIGLVRSEFLFHQAGGMPDEEAQYRVYRRVVEWAAGRPVVVRTLDAGGDKPIAGLTIAGESNPFLGTRGIRLSLLRPEIFRIQLRALARAAVHGDLKVMLPMVTVPAEIEQAGSLLGEAVAALVAEGFPARLPPLGIMVEVPAVAIVPEMFAGAAFFSIGSNDLTQYVTASARDITGVASLDDPGHPAVLALIGRVVSAGKNLRRDVSLCGDMGGDPAHIAALMRTGLRSVSVAPRLVGRAKLAIAAAKAGA